MINMNGKLVEGIGEDTAGIYREGAVFTHDGYLGWSDSGRQSELDIRESLATGTAAVGDVDGEDGTAIAGHTIAVGEVRGWLADGEAGVSGASSHLIFDLVDLGHNLMDTADYRRVAVRVIPEQDVIYAMDDSAKDVVSVFVESQIAIVLITHTHTLRDHNEGEFIFGYRRIISVPPEIVGRPYLITGPVSSRATVATASRIDINRVKIRHIIIKGVYRARKHQPSVMRRVYRFCNSVVTWVIKQITAIDRVVKFWLVRNVPTPCGGMILEQINPSGKVSR